MIDTSMVHTPYPTINRAPEVGDLVIIAPLGQREYMVIALDEIEGRLVYAAPVEGGTAQWYRLSEVRVIDDEPADLS